MAAWGDNWNGQCNLPTNLLNVAALAAGDAHSVVLFGLSQPSLVRAAHARNQFSLLVPTYPGKNYVLEYKTSLKATTWTPSTTAFGRDSIACCSGDPQNPRRGVRTKLLRRLVLGEDLEAVPEPREERTLHNPHSDPCDHLAIPAELLRALRP
jgi:hypothetical protein